MSPPGMVLYKMILDDLNERDLDVERIDWESGEVIFKKYLGNNLFEETSFNIYAPTLYGAYLNLINIFAVNISKLLRYILTRFSVEDKLKKIWRNHL